MSTPAFYAYQLAYQISPILLVDGIASQIGSGTLPLVAITEATSFAQSLASGTINTDMLDFFAHFEPFPGSTIVSNAVGQYSFANQSVAANAIIRQPLSISMLMRAPVKGKGGYVSRLMTMTALKAVLDSHNSLGGTYTIATPACLYENCLLISIADIGQMGETKQRQVNWRWDFQQPLITLSAATAAANALIKNISQGLPPP